MSKIPEDKASPNQEIHTPDEMRIEPVKIQRWCIVRKYSQDQDDPHLNIAVANASDELLQTIPFDPNKKTADLEEYFSSLEADQLEWWQDEDADEGLRLPLSKFRAKLETLSEYFVEKPAHEQLIEEGMVFIRIQIQEPRFVHFTYQARNLSEKVYSQLTGDVIEDQSPAETA